MCGRVPTVAQAQQLEKSKKQASLECSKLAQLCLDSSAVERSTVTSIQHLEQAASRQCKGEHNGRGRHVHASISYDMVTKLGCQDAMYICGSTGSRRWAGLMGQNLTFITHCLNILVRSLFYRHWDRLSGRSDSFDTTFACKHFILHGFYAHWLGDR